MDKDLITAIALGAAAIIGAFVNPAMGLIKTIFCKIITREGDKECQTISVHPPCVEYATKSDLENMELRIMTDAADKFASKMELDVVRGKLDEIAKITNATNATVDVINVRMEYMQKAIDAMIAK